MAGEGRGWKKALVVPTGGPRKGLGNAASFRILTELRRKRGVRPGLFGVDLKGVPLCVTRRARNVYGRGLLIATPQDQAKIYARVEKAGKASGKPDRVPRAKNPQSKGGRGF